jgi:hypothetical protein
MLAHVREQAKKRRSKIGFIDQSQESDGGQPEAEGGGAYSDVL